MSLKSRIKALQKKMNIDEDELITEIFIEVTNADGSIDSLLVTHKKGNEWTELEEVSPITFEE